MHLYPSQILIPATLGLALVGPAMADSVPTGQPELVHESLDKYWDESLSGGPPKDGIPSIDEPRFESADQADGWLEDGSKLIGLYRNGQARAYPQSVLVWHEIVNDTIGGDQIAVTYCPLTGTALGFERGRDELGVSGRLVNSNLIMYNRATDTYWPQILAAGIQGPQKGQGLNEVRVIWTDWASWKSRHPETEVLSRRTGFGRNYRRDPYGGYNPPSGYYADSGVMFPLFAQDDRYPDKHEILGFRTADKAVAIDPEALARAGHLRHEGETADFLILHDPGLGTGWVYRALPGDLPDDAALADIDFTAAGPAGKVFEDLEPVNVFEAMWFAWHAFYPDTIVIDRP